MNHKKVANKVCEFTRDVYQLGNIIDVQNLITRLDELLGRIKDVRTLRELQADATAHVEAKDFEVQFAIGPFMNVIVGLIATFMAILAITFAATNGHIQEWQLNYAVWVGIIVLVTLSVVLIYLAIRGPQATDSKVAHVLIRDAIERRMESVVKTEGSGSSQPNYSAGNFYEPWPPGIPVKN